MTPRSGNASPPSLLLMGNYSNKTGFAWRNIYRLFKEIGKSFSARGVRPCVSFTSLDGSVDWLSDVDWPVEELDPLPRSTEGIRRLSKVIRAANVRYVYLTDCPPTRPLYGMMRLAGVRRILVHDRISVPSPSKVTRADRGFKGSLKYVGARTPLMTADRIYAVSDFVRARLVLRNRVPPDRVRVILNGIDLQRFSPSSAPRDGGPLRVFAGARASVHKGIDVLIRAADLLRSRHGMGDFEIVYAGDGPALPSLKRLVEELDLSDCVRLLGEVESTETLLAAADIVVIPSVWGDACPSAVMEGLASGKPVVATRVGGVPEIIGEPENALLVEPGDPGALAAALAQLAADPERRRALGERGRQRAEDALDETRYHREVIRQMLADCGIRDEGPS